MNDGLIYLFTGEGKGKTSAALGTLLRGIGNGWSVGWVSLYKEESWKLSEFEFLQSLSKEARDRVEMKLLGKGFFIKNPSKIIEEKVKVAQVNEAVVIDDNSQQAHQHAAEKAISEVEKMLESKHFDLIIIDEVCNALADGLLTENAVLQVLKKREHTHIVLTGRFASEKLISTADLVSDITNFKHPFDSGKNAVKGLDF